MTGQGEVGRTTSHLQQTSFKRVAQPGGIPADSNESSHMTKRPNCSEQCTMYITKMCTKSQVSVNDLLELIIGN